MSSELIPELAKKGVELRSFGQTIIEMLGEKRVHPNAAIPGGMNKALSPENREFIAGQIDEVIADSLLAVNLVKDFAAKNMSLMESFGNFIPTIWVWSMTTATSNIMTASYN